MPSASETDSDLDLRYLDKSTEARYVYWSSLLGGNGLMFAAAAILASASWTDRVLLLFFLAAAATSSVFVILNFRSVKTRYEYILSRREEIKIQYAREGDAAISFDDEGGIKEGLKIKRRERDSLKLMAFELLLMVAMVLF